MVKLRIFDKYFNTLFKNDYLLKMLMLYRFG